MRSFQDSTVVFPPFCSSIHHPLLFGLSFAVSSAPPLCFSLVHPFATISPTFSSLVYKNPFVIHHPLFSSLPLPIIVPDTQSLHFYTPPSSFSPFNLPSCFSHPSFFPSLPVLPHVFSSPPLLCFSYLLSFTSFHFPSIPVFFSPSPPNSPSCYHIPL